MSFSLKKHILISSSYYFAFLLLVTVASTVNSDALLKFDFLPWDAKHVSNIVKNGYDSVTSAFYPLFPFLWRLIGLDAFGISILNGLIFILASAILMAEFKADLKASLLYSSFPLFAFMFLPYSESFLFLFGVLMYKGFNQRKMWLVYFSLFLMSITKPTAGVFLPGIIIAEILSEHFAWRKLAQALIMMTIVVVSNVLVLLLQFTYTHDWFSFFNAQSAWGNKLMWPNLPLTTWNHQNMIWIDSSALWFCLCAGLILCYLVWLRFFRNVLAPKSLTYALLYLFGTGLFVLFFRGGQLFSLGRFVFASPFIIIALYEGSKLLTPYSNKWFPTLFAFGFLLVSLIAGSYLHIKLILAFLGLAVFLGMWFYILLNRTRTVLWIFVLFVLFVIQVWCSVSIVKGEWIG